MLNLKAKYQMIAVNVIKRCVVHEKRERIHFQCALGTYGSVPKADLDSFERNRGDFPVNSYERQDRKATVMRVSEKKRNK